ncbi:putative bifunctional diguanylate cyclase/phosphodiesterase [Noviherbaspirillum pedocola]|uniref:GGDEF domain-containing protein n=1 Tax=Noviherbaspirillum pedocola TaxID=2801341 RepID=A0A934W488_9BURK|nr:EAL domain-containing protein [Noviherbaspirillum pedocola]MBK4733617.1 GGDEF domain-containing protein [Noviherbaspirillum pedocola]
MFSHSNNPLITTLQSRLSRLVEAAGDLVLILSEDCAIIHASQRALALFGPSGDYVGRQMYDLVDGPDRHALAATLAEAISSRERQRVNLRIQTSSGSQWFELEICADAAPGVSAGESLELLVIGRNISGQKETRERLLHIATHDTLTGLPNRALLSDRLRMALAQARRVSSGFSVLALDLDGFRKVNDALGYGAGDALLCEAAARMQKVLRDHDTLARVGGDRFLAILPGVRREAEIMPIARRMIGAVQLPFEIEGQSLYVSASVGAAVYPEHGENEVRLLAHAETAMTRAKETGRARCVVYNSDTFASVDHDVSMEAAMFEAVRNGEFFLQYQPIVRADNREIVGFEALMRWRHPELGLISPGQFIHMAESNGLINLLGAWVLKAACVQLASLQEAAGRDLYVSVNVSPRQFRNDQFLHLMDDALKLSGIAGRQLLLEITEGILMSDPAHAEDLLQRIASRGVRIAIDDFGTGYSSLAYLKRFPISTLKIDRAFIKDLPRSVKDAAICNVVLSLAMHLDLNTVAEGVENEEQLAFLMAHGCGLIQGFHTGRPMLFADALQTLKDERARVERAPAQTRETEEGGIVG